MIQAAIAQKGFKIPSPIQEKTIPVILDTEKDIIAISQTGSGKTAGFGLPILQKIRGGEKNPSVLVLVPTRELAMQVTKELASYCGKKRINLATIYGGQSINFQIKQLQQGVDIVVGTPGRVVDLIERKQLQLRFVEYVVLDEADEMLNMGFQEDLEFILKSTPQNRRTFLFSATMPKKVVELARKYIRKEVEHIEIESKVQDLSHIKQYFYATRGRPIALLRHILNENKGMYAIVFCRTQNEVELVSSRLRDTTHAISFIHGGIIQRKRERILQTFRDQKFNILVATDVAARGLDVKNLTHVINFAFPQQLETYIHRIGRTGRAGNTGIAITFCPANETYKIKQLEKNYGVIIEELQIPKEVVLAQSQSQSYSKDLSHQNRGFGGDRNGPRNGSRNRSFGRNSFRGNRDGNRDGSRDGNRNRDGESRPRFGFRKDNENRDSSDKSESSHIQSKNYKEIKFYDKRSNGGDFDSRNKSESSEGGSRGNYNGPRSNSGFGKKFGDRNSSGGFGPKKFSHKKPFSKNKFRPNKFKKD